MLGTERTRETEPPEAASARCESPGVRHLDQRRPCVRPPEQVVKSSLGLVQFVLGLQANLLLLGLGVLIQKLNGISFSHTVVFLKSPGELVTNSGIQVLLACLTPRTTEDLPGWGRPGGWHALHMLAQNPRPIRKGCGPLTRHDSLTGRLLETRPSPHPAPCPSPAQGLEIVNPQAAEKKVAEANQKYFSSMAEFLKVKGEKSGITST